MLSLPILTGVLLGQAPPAPAVPSWLMWFFVWGEPAYSIPGALGGLITWIKVVGLFSLLAWTVSWLAASVGDARKASSRNVLFNALGGVGLLLVVVSTFLGIMYYTQQVEGLSPVAVIAPGILGGLLALAWIEVRLWTALTGSTAGYGRLLLVGMHLTIALGFVVAFLMRRSAGGTADLPSTLFLSLRLGVTFTGLLILAHVTRLLIPELAALRGRRLHAIAWQSWVEAFRRMWAPWVALAVFVVILAFTAWFLQTSQPAEVSRLYVGTLMLLISLLLTMTVVILAPVSIPNDVRQQTIFTVVSKPVRRLELIWGRILGYMALVTVLLLVFGGVSLLYFKRQIGAEQQALLASAVREEQAGNVEGAKKTREQAQQLQSRMSARVPIQGSLIFFDSRNNQKRRGVDVGMELPFRSFVEGATPARALWRFGPMVPDPNNPTAVLDREIRVGKLLRPGTIEWVENRQYELMDQAATAQQRLRAADLKASDSRTLTEQVSSAQEEVKSLQGQREAMLKQERELRARNNAAETARANAMHSPGIPVEMTFTVYRTTKGVVGEPVTASLVATNPRPGITPYRDVFPVREYYTNKLTLPARMLVGSRGQLEVEVRCLSPNQYLGMAEGDLYLLASEGRFWVNFLRGLAGVWLQAMVLTAIGVFAGTFLSWPVALLMTIFFFVAGNAGFSTLQSMSLSNELVGGGPFEALIRTLTHENLMSELEATPPVILAKTLDAIVTPVMSRLVYIVPNLSALDVSNIVSSGFAVTWSSLLRLALLALAYALPFSIAAYFILKNREVAA